MKNVKVVLLFWASLASTAFGYIDQTIILNIATYQTSYSKVFSAHVYDYTQRTETTTTITTKIVHTVVLKNSQTNPQLFCKKDEGGCFNFSKAWLDANCPPEFKSEKKPFVNKSVAAFGVVAGTLLGGIAHIMINIDEFTAMVGMMVGGPIFFLSWLMQEESVDPFGRKRALIKEIESFVSNDRYIELSLYNISVDFASSFFQGTIVSENGSLVLIPR